MRSRTAKRRINALLVAMEGAPIHALDIAAITGAGPTTLYPALADLNPAYEVDRNGRTLYFYDAAEPVGGT